jgi:hypothetical protein
MHEPLTRWLMFAPLWLIAALMLACLAAAIVLGWYLRRRAPDAERDSDQEGYIVAAVTSLVGLLVGFTFSMAIDRFDSRRVGVLDEANAIEAVYLKAQLLEEPHRARVSRLLTDYVDNRIALAETRPGAERDVLQQQSDQLVTRLWAATMAAFPTIRSMDFSSSFIDGMTNVAESDAARRAARRAHVPAQVYGVLFLYQVAAAVVLGYALTGRHGRMISAALLLLFALSLVLIIELDRPSTGRIKEPQDAMLQLQASLRDRPPQAFDRLVPGQR